MGSYLSGIYKPLKFKPERSEIFVVLVSWLLVVGALSTANYIMTPERGGLYFIFYAVAGALIFGVGLPVYWTLFKKKEPLKKLGITKKNLAISLLIQLVITIALYWNKTDVLTNTDPKKLLPLISLALTIGLFEAIFWRGWIIPKLEDSFGTVPAVILGCVLYSAYHIGYGMNFDEMFFLFFIGLMFAVIFVLTRNIFVLWPLFQPFGQLITITRDNTLNLPSIAVVGFVEVLIGMIALIFILNKVAKKRFASETRS